MMSHFTADRETSFFLSSITEDNCHQDPRSFFDWFESRKKANVFSVERIPLESLRSWSFKESSGDLVHDSGGFFQIIGLKVETNFGPKPVWEQPIIDQPEIGILGILTKVNNGIRYFLMQAKMEPGNINLLQLSPTVQATRSNYTLVHCGKTPPYLDFFQDKTKSKILIDELQPEQGGRFLRKRNRNMIVEAEDAPVQEDFIWLTLGQIKRLLRIDHLVNMDARSVLSCIPAGQSGRMDLLDQYRSDCGGKSAFGLGLLESMIEIAPPLFETDEIVSWLTTMKTQYWLSVTPMPLKAVSEWKRKDGEIWHESGRHFSLMAASVEAGNREVTTWSQPFLAGIGTGLVAFVIQRKQGVLHVLVQAKVEPGHLDVIQLAPTVSCSEPDKRLSEPDAPPFLDYILNVDKESIRYDAVQSEEGGRFYHFINRCIVVELNETETVDVPFNYTWMTLRQMKDFMRMSAFNIEARNLLACISLY
jgi:dTDP-4-dehydro-6-deoxy-alpha-D-glucopyranose 2,3-dehydratase